MFVVSSAGGQVYILYTIYSFNRVNVARNHFAAGSGLVVTQNPLRKEAVETQSLHVGLHKEFVVPDELKAELAFPQKVPKHSKRKTKAECGLSSCEKDNLRRRKNSYFTTIKITFK
ncbi:hypothetical protein TNCV_3919041 [Trichonephila clavipes]|nr:hypothetical protein TNCV_3919041 [Trichonephila clavipes]